MERKGRLLLLFILLGFVKSENSLSFFFRQWEQDARRPSPAQGRCEGDPAHLDSVSIFIGVIVKVTIWMWAIRMPIYQKRLLFSSHKILPAGQLLANNDLISVLVVILSTYVLGLFAS